MMDYHEIGRSYLVFKPFKILFWNEFNFIKLPKQKYILDGQS